jgi:galactokinase
MTESDPHFLPPHFHHPVFVTPVDAETQWRRFEELVQHDAREFFDGEGPIAGGRAPGRLDVMGGVADYSGSIVLQLPLAEAACAAWQWRADRQLRIRSVGAEADGFAPDVTFSLDDLVFPDGSMRPVEEVHQRLTADPRTRWASYVAGCYYVMLAAYGRVAHVADNARLFEHGANILVNSDVPLGAGVSSSAALEVATMMALSEAAGIEPSDMTLAAWCQRVENTVVGAPCGIMDQVTSALGRQDALIVLRCQPHDLLGNQRVPPGWRFVGIDSRVKHSVGGSHYTRARVGAFMGLKIIQLESGGKLLENYLCKMSADEFDRYRELIPETLTGAEYHRLYGRLPDLITRVDPEQIYRPRACAEHPILENERARSFVALMHIAILRHEEMRNELPVQDGEEPANPAVEAELLREAGELMFAAHRSYGDRLDLGAPETDLLVELIREQGPDRGLYGARITGGGSGGTVAVLCAADSPAADEALTAVCREYERRTGNVPRLFLGSSPGAVMFGARPIIRG